MKTNGTHAETAYYVTSNQRAVKSRGRHEKKMFRNDRSTPLGCSGTRVMRGQVLQTSLKNIQSSMSRNAQQGNIYRSDTKPNDPRLQQRGFHIRFEQYIYYYQIRKTPRLLRNWSNRDHYIVEHSRIRIRYADIMKLIIKAISGRYV